MAKKHTHFKKIQQFITEEYNHLSKIGLVIVKSAQNEFKINDLTVKYNNFTWQIYDNSSLIIELKQRRMAILAAVMIINNKKKKMANILSLDKQLDIYLDDKSVFSSRLKKNPHNYVMEDRLSKVEAELNFIESQISELEKSVSLQ